MKGKKVFTKTEAQQIVELIKRKLSANSSEQKKIRNKIRALGFYASDFGLSGGYTERDFLGTITIIGDKKEDAEIPMKIFENQSVKEDKEIFGLDPIFDKNSYVLILGTMPGAESLKNQEYYSYSRNLFWDLVSEILNKKKPTSYTEKKKLLLDHKIAIWDVCKTCVRKGSLDADIQDEIPNDLETFIKENKNIKTIAFNGQEAAKLFGKYFKSIAGIKLLNLPSTSPANAGQSWNYKIAEWSKIIKFL